MDVIVIKFENMKDILTTPNRNGTIVSQKAYEDFILTAKGAPILYDDSPIGVMTGEDEGLLYAECLPEIIAKEGHIDNDVYVIDSFEFSSVGLGKVVGKEK